MTKPPRNRRSSAAPSGPDARRAARRLAARKPAGNGRGAASPPPAELAGGAGAAAKDGTGDAAAAPPGIAVSESAEGAAADLLDRAAGAALLGWYDRHRRHLPWRADPGERADPYRVWLSEIMLQQTTVAAVRSYYASFLERWPTVADLAAAPDEEVMAAWAGLGYYARARNLLACAREVATGAFPTTRAGLVALPGVGDYTSAAIAAIAFGEAVPVVDGNVERVVARLTRLDRPPKAAKGVVEAAVAAMVPADRPGDFAQAMMDLGATICTPRSPACASCPLRPRCAAAACGDPLDFPVKAPKRARSVWHGVAFVPVRPDGAILLRRRPARGLLGGMAEVFGSTWGPTVAAPLDHAPFAASWTEVGSIAHGFTHAELTIDVYGARVAEGVETPGGAWWALPEDAGLPTVMKKVVTRALAMQGG